MPCPHGSGDGGSGRLRRDHLDRRSLLKSALAIGGSAALGASLQEEGDVPAGSRRDGAPDPPERQHAWNAYLPQDAHGNVSLPAHQLVVFVDHVGSVPPAPAERRRVEAALRSLERALQRGNGGEGADGVDARPDGLLATIGYAPRYFEQFDGSLPSSVDLPPPERVLDAVGQDPGLADAHDAVLVLCSDLVSVLLSAEQALFGQLDTLFGTAVEGSFEGVLARRERRTGFVGTGLPAERLDADVPEASPQAMGYRSGFRGNQASEDRVTIGTGPFAGGTTQHVSRLAFDLDRWYDEDEPTRVRRMFTPSHTPEQVGDAGEFLAGDSGVTRESVDRIADVAAEQDVVGHTQKLARARDEEFDVRILRRSEGVSTDLAVPGMNFSSVQRTITDFREVLEAMHDESFEEAVPAEANGIRSYVETRARGNYLVPPRRHRALPAPRPGDDDGSRPA